MNNELALVLAGALMVITAATRLALIWPNAAAARTASAGYGTAPAITGALVATLLGIAVFAAGTYLLIWS
jgi:hypothetical protein